MKKLFVVLLVLVLAAGFVACGGGGSGDTSPAPPSIPTVPNVAGEWLLDIYNPSNVKQATIDIIISQNLVDLLLGSGTMVTYNGLTFSVNMNQYPQYSGIVGYYEGPTSTNVLLMMNTANCDLTIWASSDGTTMASTGIMTLGGWFGSSSGYYSMKGRRK